MNEQSLLVSVIVPVYKVEQYLQECVDSILAQTYRNLEILLIDDGSPDHCGAICDQYALTDPRIKVIHQTNGGLSAARNAGLDIASGDLITFVDSDDFIAENMIETMVRRLSEAQADLVICDIAYCHNREDIWFGGVSLPDRTFTLAEFVQEDQPTQYIVAWNKLYRRFLFDNVRYPVGYIHEDKAVIHHILGQCKTIAAISQALYFYRQTPGSIMNAPVTIKRSDRLSALADRLQYAYHKKWNKIWNTSAARYVQIFFDLYFRFPRNAENSMYFGRMDASLKKALPYLLRSSHVSIRHKVYLSIIRMSPRLYILMRRLTNKNTS